MRSAVDGRVGRRVLFDLAGVARLGSVCPFERVRHRLSRPVQLTHLETERDRASWGSETADDKGGSLRAVEGLDNGCHGFDTGCRLVREVAANLVESSALKTEECVGDLVDVSGEWLAHL